MKNTVLYSSLFCWKNESGIIWNAKLLKMQIETHRRRNYVTCENGRNYAWQCAECIRDANNNARKLRCNVKRICEKARHRKRRKSHRHCYAKNNSSCIGQICSQQQKDHHYQKRHVCEILSHLRNREILLLLKTIGEISWHKEQHWLDDIWNCWDVSSALHIEMQDIFHVCRQQCDECIEAVCVGHVSDCDRKNWTWSQNCSPWWMNAFLLTFTLQTCTNEIFFILQNPTVSVRTFTNNREPNYRPYTTSNAKNIENTFPTESFSEKSREKHRNHSTNKTSWECISWSSTAFERWRPFGVDAVDAGKCESTENSLNNSCCVEILNAIVAH